MPETVITEETFAADVTEDELDGEVKLRIQAGAIRSSYKNGDGKVWTLSTEWNVIGQNAPG